MKFALASCILVLAVLAYAESELPLAEPCNKDVCKSPNCRCSSVDIPGGFDARDTPQVCLKLP